MEKQIASALAFHFECLAEEGVLIPEPLAEPQPDWDWGYVEVEMPAGIGEAARPH